MDNLYWILISIAIMIIFLGVLAYFANRGKKRPMDYYSFFITGIIWFPLGIVLKNYFLAIIGGILLAISLANKDKWKKNRIRWEDLTKQEKKWRTILIIVLGILVLVGFVFFFLSSKGIL